LVRGALTRVPASARARPPGGGRAARWSLRMEPTEKLAIAPWGGYAPRSRTHEATKSWERHTRTHAITRDRRFSWASRLSRRDEFDARARMPDRAGSWQGCIGPRRCLWRQSEPNPRRAAWADRKGEFSAGMHRRTTKGRLDAVDFPDRCLMNLAASPAYVTVHRRHGLARCAATSVVWE
jgi:hypothetical protein